MSADQISRGLGIARNTLQRHFHDELRTSVARARAEIISMLFAAARRGNTAAMKHLEAITRTGLAAEEPSRTEETRPRPRH